MLSVMLLSYLYHSTAGAGDHDTQCPCRIYVLEGWQVTDCSNQNLSSIPDCIPNTTQFLDFQFNDLRYTPGQFQRFRNITVLGLIANFNFVAHNDSFRFLFQLDTLDLSFTDFTYLTGEAFVDQSYLTRLYLIGTYGKLHVTQELFTHLGSLKWLDLSRKNDFEVPNFLFTGLPLLEKT